MKTDESKPILCGTDFSENAAQAALVADALARRLGVPLMLVRSADERQEFPDSRELEAQLRALIPAGAEKRGVRMEVRLVESSDAAKAIVEAAARFDADLVCIGTHGRSGLAAAVLGSVAQAVIAQRPRPVLVVRPRV